MTQKTRNSANVVLTTITMLLAMGCGNASNSSSLSGDNTRKLTRLNFEKKDFKYIKENFSFSQKLKTGQDSIFVPFTTIVELKSPDQYSSSMIIDLRYNMHEAPARSISTLEVSLDTTDPQSGKFDWGFDCKLERKTGENDVYLIGYFNGKYSSPMKVGTTSGALTVTVENNSVICKAGNARLQAQLTNFHSMVKNLRLLGGNFTISNLTIR